MLLSFLFFVFLPVTVFIGPLLYTIWYLGYKRPERKARYGSYSCCRRVLTHLLYLLIIMPLGTAFAAVLTFFVGAILILPLYYYSIAHLVRMIYIGCVYKL